MTKPKPLLVLVVGVLLAGIILCVCWNRIVPPSAVSVAAAKAKAQEEEARFLKVVTDVYTRQEVPAALAIMCWDRVPDREKWEKLWASTEYGFFNSHQRDDRVGAEYIDLKAVETITSLPSPYFYNVPVTKCIRIHYWRRGPSQTDWRWEDLPVGEKNGKLMIAQRVKRPWYWLGRAW